MADVPPTTPRSVNGHPHGRVPRAVREEQLLEVAESVFAMQGYQGTSIEDIARAAGVTRPVIYDHFGSKENIYLACVRQARAELERLFDEAAGKSQNPREKLWGGINAYLEFVERHGRAWDVLFGQGGAVTGAAGEELMRQRFATVNRSRSFSSRSPAAFRGGSTRRRSRPSHTPCPARESSLRSGGGRIPSCRESRWLATTWRSRGSGSSSSSSAREEAARTSPADQSVGHESRSGTPVRNGRRPDTHSPESDIGGPL